MSEEITGFGLVAVVVIIRIGPRMRRPPAIDAFADIAVDLAMAPQIDVMVDRVGPHLPAVLEYDAHHIQERQAGGDRPDQPLRLFVAPSRDRPLCRQRRQWPVGGAYEAQS